MPAGRTAPISDEILGKVSCRESLVSVIGALRWSDGWPPTEPRRRWHSLGVVQLGPGHLGLPGRGSQRSPKGRERWGWQPVPDEGRAGPLQLPNKEQIRLTCPSLELAHGVLTSATSPAFSFSQEIYHDIPSGDSGILANFSGFPPFVSDSMSFKLSPLNYLYTIMFILSLLKQLPKVLCCCFREKYLAFIFEPIHVHTRMLHD